MTELQAHSEADLRAAIAVLESQRALLGNAVADAALAPLRARLPTRLPTPAAAAAPGDPQFRQVTVLFLDIVGSTTLSQRLDPEETHELMDGALARFTARVQDFGGRVLQYAGDNLLAAFGADGASEDDAERAVSAGLALLEAGREFAAEVARQHRGAGFNVRVGLHTGPVLLGGGVNAEGSIRGLTVNVAARMEQTAPAGGLRISHDTWRQVRGLFDVLAQQPIEVKGVDQPLQTYLVQAARPRAFRVPTRGIDGVEVAMVGRDGDIAQLLGAFDALAHQRRAGAITLVADAGLGKSRLIAEFRSGLELHLKRPQWLLARAQPNTVTQPYGLLRDLLSWRLLIADSDSAEVAQRKLVHGLAPFFADEGQRPAQLLGQLIGLDFAASPLLADVKGSGAALRAQAFAAGVTLLHRMAASEGEPLVVLVEDLHWADDGSLDFLGALMMANDVGLEPPPLLLVMATRPALFERRSDWAAAAPQHVRLDLAPLGASDSLALGRSLLGRLTGAPEAVQAVCKLIVDDAEGNPFYMEELIKMLVDDGVIHIGEALWEVHAGRLAQAHVPRTLTGVLQARLDSLQAAERQALQQAALIGHVFWGEALEALHPGATGQLPALLKKQLIVRRDGSAFEGTAEYAFHHHLLQQVAHDTLLKAPRRAGHAAAAAWLVQRLGDRGGELLAVAAEHYERAGDDSNALKYFDQAAQSALDRSAQTAVMSHLARALASPALTDPARRLELLQMRVHTADWLGWREQQQADLGEAEALAEQLGNDLSRSRLLIDRSFLADRLGDAISAERFARQAWRVAESCGDARSATLSLGMIAWAHHQRHELDEAARSAALALEWAKRTGPDTMYPVQILLVSANIAQAADDAESAVVSLAEAYELALPLPRNVRLIGSILLLGATVAYSRNHFERGREQGLAALEHGRRHGLAMIEANALVTLCDCSRESGDLEAAENRGLEALAAHERSGSAEHRANALVALGRTRLLAGRVAQALADFERAAALQQSGGLRDEAAESRGWCARALQQSGDLAAARALIETELDLGLAKQASPSLLLNTHLVLHAVGDPRARDLIDRAHAALQARAQRCLDEVSRQRVLQGSAVHRELLAAWAASAPSPELP